MKEEEDLSEFIEKLMNDPEVIQRKKKRIQEYEKFIPRLNELEQKCNQIGLDFDYYIFPLKFEGKFPCMGGLSWTKDRKSLQVNHEDVLEGIKSPYSGNYAIAGTHLMSERSKNENYVSLTILDIDLEKNGEPKLPRDKIFELIEHMDTFTVQTRSGGYHLYLATRATFAKSIEEKSGVKNPHPLYNGKDFGELRMASSYIAGVGSYIPPDKTNEKTVNNPEADGYYKVFFNRPIRLVDKSDFPSWISLGKETEFKTSKKGNFSNIEINIPSPDELVKEDPNEYLNENGVSLSDIRLSEFRLNLALSGVDEFEKFRIDVEKKSEPDRSGADFYTANTLRKYKFSPDQIGKILIKFRPFSKTLRVDYIEGLLRAVFNKKDGSGYQQTKKYGDELPFEVKECDTFPDKLTDKKCVILNGLPRTGKSHYSLFQLGKIESGIYVAPNYAIEEKQFKKFCELYPEKKTVILYGKGKKGACNTEKKNCSSCPLKPLYNFDQKKKIIENNPSLKDKVLTFSELEYEAKKFCNKHKKIDLESVPKGFCKYHFLHSCENFVDFVFTIPFYTVADEEKWPHLCIKKRELMVIDEDTSFRHFMAKEFQIASLQKTKGVAKIENNLSNLESDLKKIKEEHIIKKRNVEDEKIIINSIIDYLFSISNQIDDFNISTGNSDSKEENDSKVDFDTFYEKLLETKPYCNINNEEILVSEIGDDLKRSALKIIEDICSEVSEPSQRASITNIFIAVLYPLSLNHLANFETKNKNKAGTQMKHELYLIPEQYGYCRLPKCAEKFLLIGYTEAEIFSENLVNNTDDIVELKTDRFDYSKNFFLLVACGKSEADDKRLLKRFIKKLLQHNESEKFKSPFMVLTSSIKKQEMFTSGFKGERKLVNVQDEDTYDLFLNFCIGKHIVFFQNSKISRGLDIPWIDIMFVDSCQYLLPYYRAKIEGCKRFLLEIKEKRNEHSQRLLEISKKSGSGDEYNLLNLEGRSLFEEKEKYQILLDDAELKHNNLIMDESTNSMLRFSPIKNYCEENCKFLFLKRDDLQYLKEEARSKFREIELTDENMDDIVKLVHNYSIKIDFDTGIKRAIGDKIKNLIPDFSEDEIKKALEDEAIDLGKSYDELLIDPDYSQIRFFRIYLGIKTILSHPNFSTPLKDKKFSKSRSYESLISWIKKRRKDDLLSDSVIEKCLDIIVNEDGFLSKSEQEESSGDKKETTTSYYIDYEKISDIEKFKDSNFFKLYEEFKEKIDSKEVNANGSKNSKQSTLTNSIFA